MKLWLRILISAGLFVLLFLLLPWAQVRDALLKLPPGTWAFVLAGFVAGHGVGVFKWRLFVNAGRASLRVRDAVQCYSAGLFALSPFQGGRRVIDVSGDGRNSSGRPANRDTRSCNCASLPGDGSAERRM